MVGEVTSLTHEARDDSMERRARESESLLSCKTKMQDEQDDDTMVRLEIEIGWYVAGPSSSFDFLALTCAEGAEVLGRLRDDVGTKLHDNAACRLSANGDVEVNLGVGPARRGNEINDVSLDHCIRHI